MITPGTSPVVSYLVLSYLALAGVTALFYLAWGLQHLVALRAQLRRVDALPEPSRWPDVTILVPARGDGDPEFEANVRALLAQQYPGKLTTVFCFESDDDPAAVAIERITNGWKTARCCVAGNATQCGQKNHNLLAGVELEPEADVYLIADVDILPPSNWVRDMVRDLALDPEVSATTGFYYRIPTRSPGSIGDYFSALVVGWIATGMARDSMGGLWGGSLAVRGDFLREPEVRARLERAIVDDMCLREELMKRGGRRTFAPTCVVPSYVETDLPGALRWAVRQGQYTQLHDPMLIAATWATLAPAAFTLAVWPLVLLTAVMLQMWWVLAILGAILLIWFGVGATFWAATPSRDPRLPRFSYLRFVLFTPLAFVLSSGILGGMVANSNRKTLQMRWRDISYEVDRRDGSVISIERPAQTDGTT